MTYTKRISAALLAVILTAAALPFTFAHAAENGVQKKLDEIRAVYDTGTYFTADGNPCHSNQNDNCRLSRIPARGALPSGAEVFTQLKNESWSCRSFADYVFYYVFGEAYWNIKKSDAPVFGDFIKFNGGRHSSIYLSEDEANYYVYDSNGDSSNGVYYNRAYSKSYWKLYGAYHASNYDKIMSGGSAAVFREINAGSYFVSNAQSGLYLSKNAPEDAHVLYTLTDAHAATLTAEVKQTADGATLSIPGNGGKQTDWIFEVAPGGYVIRSKTQPAKALTAGSNGNVALSDFTGSASQLWKLEAAYHKLTRISASPATCTARGETVYACADCDYAKTEYQPMKAHVYTVKTVEPGKNIYGFTKYKCVGCGEVQRKDVKEKLDAQALIDTGDILQTDDGVVYISANVTDEDLLDAFPGYLYEGDPAASSGVKLIPGGADSVPEKDFLTVILPGDINGDGKVNAIDARTILRLCVSADALEEDWQQAAADIDFDEKITPDDARWILRTAVGYETGATTLAGIEE